MATKNLQRSLPLPPAITSLSVAGFKSLVHSSSIAVRPLTLLAGANSSGKSSALQPLLLLKQTLDSPFDPGPLLLHDGSVRFTSIDQVLSHPLGAPAATEFRAGVQLNDREGVTSVFRPSGSAFELVETTFEAAHKKAMRLTPDLTPAVLRHAIPPELNKLADALIKLDQGDLRVERNRCFLEIKLLPDHFPLALSTDLAPSRRFADAIRRVVHVPGLRGNPRRSYRTTAAGDAFPGTFENYVASVVQAWQRDDTGRLHRLNDALTRLGLTWKVQAKQINANEVALRVGRLPRPRRGGARDLVDIADVGLGVSQALPVLVALVLARPGQLVYLEQPEIHLHPRAQIELARLMADVASSGAHIVVETHSQLLLLGIQALVAEGRLPSDMVALHWFERDSDGVTSIRTAELDDTGAYGDWPEDFGSVQLALDARYIAAAETKNLQVRAKR